MSLRHLFLLTLLLSGCTALPEEDSEANQTENTDGERLIVSPPDGWQRAYQINTDELKLSDFIPPGELIGSWTTRLSFEAHKASDLAFDPLDLLAIDAQSELAKCRSTQKFNVHAGFENNYETAVQLLMCTENINVNRGEVSLIKAIRGDQFYYAIRLIRRIPPFKPGEHQLDETEIAYWSEYLSRIYVCDDSDAHPCEQPTATESN